MKKVAIPASVVMLAAGNKKRKRITCNVGKFVPMPGNKAAILINGKPEGNVYSKKEGNKKVLYIELCGEKIKIIPSGPNGKMTKEDDTEMRYKVAEVYLDNQ